MTQAVKTRDVLGPDQAHCRQSGKRILKVRHLLRDKFELISGQVLGKYPAPAVVNQATGRWQRRYAYPVAP